ncbi:MAG: glycosyltransferase [Jatrophihabitantaceae bacterium]
MKIAMISEHASPLARLGEVDAGGQNVHVAALSAALAERGHQVVVYTRRDSAELPERVPMGPGVRVEHITAGPARPIPKDDLLPHMKPFAAQLCRRWRLWRPDVVHAHFWMSGVAAQAAVATLDTSTAMDDPPIPVAQTFHALGSVKRRWQSAADTSPAERIGIERRIARSADRIIATCSEEVTELRRLGATAASIDVIPCGVDTELFTPDGPAEPRSDRQRIVCVGRLVPRKGVDDVIRAVLGLPDVELLIAGGPPADRLDGDVEVARLRALAGDSAAIRLLGQLSHDRLPSLLRSADLVVCAPWYEPFGIVPLEAMACGVPVLATAVGGLLDTVLPWQTGVLVPAKDPEALRAAISRLLADADLRRALAEAGARRARDCYSWPAIAAATEGSYQSMLDAQQASRIVLGAAR